MTKKRTEPRRCIFCGNSSTTKEHVWSKWTYAFVPREALKHDRIRTSTSRNDARIAGITTAKAYNGGVNTIKLKVVCGPCNNGWMSKLDKAAKRVLIPLITGDAALLAESDQALVAAWIAMKIMVCEFEEPETVVTPQSEREHVMRTQSAPATWQIWIANHRDRRWTNSFYRGLSHPSGRNRARTARQQWSQKHSGGGLRNRMAADPGCFKHGGGACIQKTNRSATHRASVVALRRRNHLATDRHNHSVWG